MKTNLSLTYITLFPDLIAGYLQDALLKKAIDQNVFKYEIINLRNYSDNNYKSVDEKVYGDNDGMILRPDIADKVFTDLNKKNSVKSLNIYMSPQGKKLNQELLNELASYDHINILCGRYGGVDHRIIDQYIDVEISIGDYILSGGELAALVLTESLSRLVKGVVGNAESVVEDSLSKGLLESPQFTKPQVYQGSHGELKVPSVLLSGHHERINLWKNITSVMVTYFKRKDLLDLYIKDHMTKKMDHDLISQFKKIIKYSPDFETDLLEIFESDEILEFQRFLKQMIQNLEQGS